MWHPKQPEQQHQPAQVYVPFQAMAMQQQSTSPSVICKEDNEALRLSQLRRQKAMLAAAVLRKVA